MRWHKKLNEGGWVAVHWPKEYGGRGATVMQRLIFREELSRLGLGEPGLGNGHRPARAHADALGHRGAEAVAICRKFQKARKFWCQGYSEPGLGIRPCLDQTRAVEDGDDFVVNGQKGVDLDGAASPTWIFLLVRTDPDAPKHKGISYLLVDMHSPGITVRPLVQMTGGKGFNEVFFEDVRVPRKNIVSEKNNGWQVAMTTLMFERSGSAARRRLAQVNNSPSWPSRLPRNGGTAWDDSACARKSASSRPKPTR